MFLGEFVIVYIFVTAELVKYVKERASDYQYLATFVYVGRVICKLEWGGGRVGNVFGWTCNCVCGIVELA
jgi:hypothetical protein